MSRLARGTIMRCHDVGAGCGTCGDDATHVISPGGTRSTLPRSTTTPGRSDGRWRRKPNEPRWRAGWRDASRDMRRTRRPRVKPGGNLRADLRAIQVTRHLGAPYPLLGGREKETGSPAPDTNQGPAERCLLLLSPSPPPLRCLTTEY